MSLPDLTIEHARLIIRDPIVRKDIKTKFGRNALKKVMAWLDAGGADADRVLGWLDDVVGNDGEIYATFTAGCEDDTYSIKVRGLGGLYWTWAPEYGSHGFFSTLPDAEDYVLGTWNDNLISSASERHRKAFVVATQKTAQDSSSSTPNQQSHLDYLEDLGRKFDEKMRDSGLAVTVKEPSDSTEFTATFPQGRPPAATPRTE